VEAGTTTIVATPHIRGDYPFAHERIAELAERLRASMARAGIRLELLTGGEIALSELDLIDDDHMRYLALGSGHYVLVESPYGEATDMLEGMLFDLQTRGFKPVLAHPERSRTFLGDPERLTRLVRTGVLCSVTAASMEGRFGRKIRRYTVELFRDGLVHDVASDAHAARGRAPGIADGFRPLERELRGIAKQVDWYTRRAPAAMVTGRALPPRPPTPTDRRLFRRAGQQT
jgi:protein-tyrosine phosphatase